MGYKSIIQILLILAIISTICISIMKPKMHKPVIVYNSQFSFNTENNAQIDTKNLPVMVQNTNVSQNDNNVIIQNNNNSGINQIQTTSGNLNNISFNNNVIPQSQNVNFSNQNSSFYGFRNSNVKTNSTNIKPANTGVSQSNSRVRNINTSNRGSKIDLNRIVQNNQKIINTPADFDDDTPAYKPPVQNRQPQRTVQPKAQTQTTKPSIRLSSNTTSTPVRASSNTQSQAPALTAQEEEIAWNKWRSNLNNQIMRDSKLPTMPNGIVFKYKFTVDKYGKVSNVQTSSTTPGYTPYAIQFIAPVIRSYQGRSILNFPAGSRRVTTVVSGAWRISNTSKYSSPDDYHDIEKIKG